MTDRAPLPAVVALALAVAAHAQDASRRTRPPVPAMAEITRQFACVSARGPEVLAVGRGWRASFGNDDVEFRPALGRGASRAWPMRLQLLQVRRGDAVISARELPAERRVFDRPAANTSPHDTVEFVRPGLVERYQARPEGLEQSFAFAAPPRGSGDLVVTLRARTDLPPGKESATLLSWIQPGVGGVQITAVVGQDALGRRVAGSMHRSGEQVDLVLPGWFVDAAAYPLVLDPLLGPVTEALAGYDIDFPDAAYEPFSDSYCLCWTMYSGGGASDAVGAVYRASDRQLAYAFVINQTGDEDSIRVASIGGMGVFVLVWCNLTSGPSSIQIATMALEPTQGMGSQVYIIAGPGNVDTPQLSSEATVYDDDCLIIWDDSNAGVVGASLQVNPDLTMSMTAPIVIGGGPAATELALSKQGGNPGLHVVTWVDRAQVVDHDMVLQGPAAWIQNVPENAGRPAVDGDGFLFFVAWEQQELASPASTDVLGKVITVSPAGITTIGQAFAVAVYPTFLDGAPDVAMLGDRFGVVYQSGIPNQPYIDDVFFRTFERNGNPIGGELRLDVTTAGHYQFEHAPRIIGRRDGDATTAADDGLCVFADQDNQSAESDIGLQAVEAIGPGGPVVDLGGGCGPAGLCSVRGPCALGNATFAIDLHGAQTLAVPFLIVDYSSRPPLGCGVCTVTDPDLWLFGANTAGTATCTLPLPGAAVFDGLALELQWAALNVAYVGCPLVPGAAASNRVRATIGY
jgi:hypothetical protein